MKIKELKNVTFVYLEDTNQLLIRNELIETIVPRSNVKSLVRFIISQVLTVNGKKKIKTKGGR